MPKSGRRMANQIGGGAEPAIREDVVAAIRARAAELKREQALRNMSASSIGQDIENNNPQVVDIVNSFNSFGLPADEQGREYSAVVVGEAGLTYELTNYIRNHPGIERITEITGEGELSWVSYLIKPEVKRNF